MRNLLMAFFVLAPSIAMAGTSFEVLQKYPLYEDGTIGYSVISRMIDEETGYNSVVLSEIVCLSEVFEDMTVHTFIDNEPYPRVDIIVPNRIPVESEKFAYRLWNSYCPSF